MQVGDRVQAVSGDYTGYYGDILSITGEFARVAHKPGFAGFDILLSDLELQTE